MIAVLAGLVLASGLALCASEANHSHGSLSQADLYRLYEDQHRDREASPIAPRSVIAGDDRFLDWAMIRDAALPLSSYTVRCSVSISNDDWLERHGP